MTDPRHVDGDRPPLDVSPRPRFAELPGSIMEDGGMLLAPCPACERGTASMDSANVIECDRGCTHALICKALFAPPTNGNGLTSLSSLSSQGNGAAADGLTSHTSLSSQAPWPAPLAPEALHGLAGRVVEAIDPHTEADPAAVLVQFLVAFGSAVGRGPGFRAESDHHGTNAYAIVVADSAKGRKGTSWGHVRRLLDLADHGWTQHCVTAGLSSGEGLIWQVRDEITKTVPVKKDGKATGEYTDEVVDPGVDDKRLLVQEGEFAQALKVLAREGNTLSPIIREAWDGRPLRTLTKNTPARATGAHISIIGHIGGDELRRFLSATEAANGFANRFLFVCARRSKVLPDGGDLADDALADLASEVRDALRSAGVTGELRRDDDARELWHSVYERLSDGKPGLFGAVTARAEAQAMRLAVLYALLDGASCITVEHLCAGLALWRYCEQSAAFIFGQQTGDPIADRALDAIAAAGTLTREQLIADVFQRHVRAADLDRALEHLLDAGYIEAEHEPTGGRPRTKYTARSKRSKRSNSDGRER